MTQTDPLSHGERWGGGTLTPAALCWEPGDQHKRGATALQSPRPLRDAGGGTWSSPKALDENKEGGAGRCRGDPPEGPRAPQRGGSAVPRLGQGGCHTAAGR